MAAARTQTIMIAPQTRRRAAPLRRTRSSGKRRSNKRGGVSLSVTRGRLLQGTMLLGGAAALGFGLIQRKIKLPGIPGVPNSLTYGAGICAVAVIAKAPKLLQLGNGPLMAGLHNIGLRGLGADVVAGDDDSTEGEFDLPESTAGEFDREEVTAGEFDDL